MDCEALTSRTSWVSRPWARHAPWPTYLQWSCILHMFKPQMALSGYLLFKYKKGVK